MSRRTGVIVGFNQDVPQSVAAELLPLLERRFPGVAFVVATNASSSIAFEWDDEIAAPGVTSAPVEQPATDPNPRSVAKTERQP